ncbi:MAG: PD-(D/E)XK nuclease family protein [Planctomycetes bacterium]|nr:PD-(D/E)XK nuclease family protein [Planctomycetota bacterium]
MAIALRILPWLEPPLRSACARLIDAAPRGALGAIDLRSTLVVLPGSRAARRLLELLVDAAAERGVRLVPPRFATPGTLALELCGEVSLRGAATRLEAQLAWLLALRGANPRALRDAFGARIAEHRTDLAGSAGWALAQELEQLGAELGWGLIERDAVLRAVADEPVADAWRAWFEIEQSATELLARAGLRFEADALREHLDREVSPHASLERVIAIAIAEWSPLARRALERSPVAVELWIHARESDRAHFDACGAPHAEPWATRALPLPEERLWIADQPADQAAAVVGVLREAAPGAALDEVAFGVLDPALAPFLVHELAGHELEARDAAGLLVERSAPHTLLSCLGTWRETRSFAALARLARHPHAARALGVEGERAEEVARLSIALDRHWRAHLQTACGVHGWIDGADERETRASQSLARATEALDQRLAVLGDERRALPQWCGALRELLLALYGADEEHEHETRIALERLAAGLAELADLPAGLAPEASGSEALAAWLAGVARTAAIPPPPRERALDLLGVLELHLEDAPVLVLAGGNEGRFPTSRYADRWLPDALRRRLGLADARQRAARDTYLLDAMLAPRRAWRIVCGRRSVEDDALLPSRLLLRAPAEELGARIVRTLERTPYARPPGIGARGARAGGSNLTIPRPKPLDEAQRKHLQTLPVSAFRAYLACPYRFYLRYALGLEPLDDRLAELDPRLFGNLAHEVLQAFGDSEVRTSRDEERVRTWLHASLEQRARVHFGPQPLIAVTVQLDMLRKRLDSFARWQVEWAEAGWRIVAVEREARSTLETSAGPIAIRGRIDRLDARGDELCVLDYKTGERTLGVEAAHRERDGDQKRWVDLQLPLYHRFAREQLASEGLRGPVQLGFLRLPRKLAETGVDLATWTEVELAEAEAEAVRIAEAIRAERFWPPNPDFPLANDDFAALCQRRNVLLPFDDESEVEGETEDA